MGWNFVPHIPLVPLTCLEDSRSHFPIFPLPAIFFWHAYLSSFLSFFSSPLSWYWPEYLSSPSLTHPPFHPSLTPEMLWGVTCRRAPPPPTPDDPRAYGCRTEHTSTSTRVVVECSLRLESDEWCTRARKCLSKDLFLLCWSLFSAVLKSNEFEVFSFMFSPRVPENCVKQLIIPAFPALQGCMFT